MKTTTPNLLEVIPHLIFIFLIFLLFMSCNRKVKQDRSRKEFKQKKVLYDIKALLLNDVIDITLNGKTPILEKLVQIVEKLNETKVDSQAKLRERLEEEKKLENKALEKIASESVLQLGELSTSITELDNLVQNVLTLFNKLCDIAKLTHNVKEKLYKVGGDMKSSANVLNVGPSTSLVHYPQVIFLK